MAEIRYWQNCAFRDSASNYMLAVSRKSGRMLTIGTCVSSWGERRMVESTRRGHCLGSLPSNLPHSSLPTHKADMESWNQTPVSAEMHEAPWLVHLRGHRLRKRDKSFRVNVSKQKSSYLSSILLTGEGRLVCSKQRHPLVPPSVWNLSVLQKLQRRWYLRKDNQERKKDLWFLVSVSG